MTKLKDILNEFKAFIMKGSLIQLAVAVVVGTAFTKLIERTVDTLFNPALKPLTGSGAGSFGVLNAKYLEFGNFLNAVLTFLITAAAVFFLIVKPLNYFFGEKKKDEPVVPPATLEDVVAELKALRAELGRTGGGTAVTAGAPSTAPVQLAKPVVRATAPPAAPLEPPPEPPRPPAGT